VSLAGMAPRSSTISPTVLRHARQVSMPALSA
jgi:hypothetical protein